MTKDFAIEATGVTYAYPTGPVVIDNVDFLVETGQFVAMLASNGSGKTTLIKVLVGVLKPQHGAVTVRGKDISRLSQIDLCQEVGVVLQNPVDQLFASTVEEDVAYGPRNLGLGEDEVGFRVTEALALVEASHLHDRPIHHLSYGQQKRICVAGVLAMKPKTLILDEPTAGLDPVGEAQMMKLLKRLNREQEISVVLATHSVDLLPLFADRICILQDGMVVAHGPTYGIFREHRVLDQAGLRMPYVAKLVHEMRNYDGVPVNGFPLTVREARTQLLELIPQEMILKRP
jgi:cobalt/nickel transport system ATP-binding protein